MVEIVIAGSIGIDDIETPFGKAKDALGGSSIYSAYAASFFAKPEIYFLAFIPYIILSMSVFYVMLEKRNYTKKDLFLGQLLGINAFSVYIKAAVSTFLCLRTTFGITGKGKTQALSYITIWPQLLMFFLNFTALIWGINRFVYEHDAAIAVNSFWALYHTLILSAIFYFNEEHA